MQFSKIENKTPSAPKLSVKFGPVITSAWASSTSFAEGNRKVGRKGLLLQRFESEDNSSHPALCKQKKRKDNVLAVSRCLTLEGECPHNSRANNIRKGHDGSREMRNICPLTISVTSFQAFFLKMWQLGNSFGISGVRSLCEVQVRDVVICKKKKKCHPLLEAELILNVKRLKC